MATIGTIAVGLVAKTAKFRVGMKGADKTLRRFTRRARAMRRSLNKGMASGISMAKGVGAMAAVAGGGLAYLVKKSTDAGDKIDKMSKRTGLSVGFLSHLGHAANLGGNQIEDMEKAVRKMTQTASDAGAGLKTYQREYAKLRVNVRGSNGELKTSEALFLEVADKLSKVENSTEKVAIASKIFGRSGTALLPMLENGKRGLAAVMRESKALGTVWDGSTTKSAADLMDNMSRVELVAANLRDRFAVGLMPTLNKLAERTHAWYMRNQQLINSKLDAWASKIGDGITAAYDQIAEWSRDNTFRLWWRRAKAAVAGFGVILAGVQSGLDLAMAGYHRLSAAAAFYSGDSTGHGLHKIRAAQYERKALTRIPNAVSAYGSAAQGVSDMEWMVKERQRANKLAERTNELLEEQNRKLGPARAG